MFRIQKKFFEQHTLIIIIIVVCAISIIPVRDSIKRMYGTVFLGLDVAGESLKEFTRPDERIFLKAHSQGHGLARYARRYTGWTDDLAEFMAREKQFDIRYICFYPAELALILERDNVPLFNYIQSNYHVKEVGLRMEPQQLAYIILERGEGSNPETFLKEFSGPRQLRTIYKIFDNFIFFYAIRPPVGGAPQTTEGVLTTEGDTKTQADTVTTSPGHNVTGLEGTTTEDDTKKQDTGEVSD
ncbi:MAG: hypothetical protein ABID09_01225 [Candidatus Omnitrophota bacterium]